MRKWKLLPGLAVKGVTQNGNTYYPYLVSCIFSVFTYYIFSSILCNDLIATLPYSTYAWMMLFLGKILLILILIPFVYYANSFLVKRRKKELGLYTLLGMERKHLIALLFLETLAVYAVSVCGGILLGLVLAKLFFLLFLRLSSFPVEAEFTFSLFAAGETLVFFAAMSLITFAHSAAGVFRMRPAELLSGSRRGEREPRFLLPGAVLGVLITLQAYRVVFDAKLDSSIFGSFFLAVFLVVTGTYLLFTCVGVAALNGLRRRKRFYYRPENFITVSGMYYRMKKSAAGLANICIFSTMVVITLTCTVALYAGLDGIRRFEAPYDATLTCEEGGVSREEAEETLGALSEKYGLSVRRLDSWESVRMDCGLQGNRMGAPQEGAEERQLYLITLADYERLTGEAQQLSDGQVLLYSTGGPYGQKELDFAGNRLQVTEVSGPVHPWPCAGKNYFGETFVMAVKDEEALTELVDIWETQTGQEAAGRKLQSGILLDGADEEKAGFMEALKAWRDAQGGRVAALADGVESQQIICSMNGGLLFIGILFGMVFFMCLLLVMYYKQLSEGYEDQGSFSIMQKVGMGEDEIRSTVRRQMLMIFALPLLTALLHSAVGICMVDLLMGVLQMFDTALLVRCGVGVALGFTVVYVISYAATSKAYYRIVLHGR